MRNISHPKSNSDKEHTLFNARSEAQIIAEYNSTMLCLKDYAHELEIPAFGSSLYGDGSPNDKHNLPDINSVIASTIASRITGKFEAPDFNAEQRLRRECNEAWLLYESNHLSKRKWSDVGLNTRGVIYRARDLVHSWLNGSKDGHRFFYQNTFWSFLEDAPIDFGPGESFTSSKGDVSFFSKLNPYKWTVTEDCVIEAALFISANKGFRRAFLEIRRKDGYAKKAKAKALGIKYKIQCKPLPGGNPALSKRILNLATEVSQFLYDNNLVQRGSRGSSVYKDSKKRRFINVECFLNVVLQKVAGYAIRKCLKLNAGVDLDLGQDKHRFLISQPGWSTVDWSNASDSILTWLVQELLDKDKKVFRLLDTFRSQFVLIDTHFINEKCKSDNLRIYHQPHKFSSMGNGFTFELLTLVNLAVARVFDRDATVYGDDVILRSVYAKDFIHHMQAVGFVPNLKKSFINLPFRESCGGFFEDRCGYIRSYDFKWNMNIADCIVTCNKLGRIVKGNPLWVHPLRDRIVRTHEKLLSLMPAALCGPLVMSDDLPQWAEHPSQRGKKQKDPYSKRKWETYSKLASFLADVHQHTELREKGYNPGFFTVVMVPELRKKVKVQPQRDVKSMRLAFTYINSGMVSPMLLRQQKNDYVFSYKPVLVHSEGWSLRASNARRIAREYSAFLDRKI